MTVCVAHHFRLPPRLFASHTHKQDGFRWLEATFRDKARGWVGFNVPFSHRLTAAADMVLMPSRFEPCGLNQVRAGVDWVLVCLFVCLFHGWMVRQQHSTIDTYQSLIHTTTPH